MGNFLPFLFIAVYQLLQKRNSKTPRKGHLYPEKWAVFSYKEMRALSRESTRPSRDSASAGFPSVRRYLAHGPKRGCGLRERGLCRWKHLWRLASHCAHLLHRQSTGCIASAFVSVSEITNKITSSDSALSGRNLASSLNNMEGRQGGVGQNRGKLHFSVLRFIWLVLCSTELKGWPGSLSALSAHTI